MSFPGFNAQSSLYKSRVHYRLAGALVPAEGVTCQLLVVNPHPFYRCGPCYYDENGQCARDCGYCVLFPSVQCYHWHEHCPCETVFGCPIGPCNLY